MLSIRNLVKIYPGPVAALVGVDLDVPNGMFGLLGPNGAGKTTLMRILAGLLEPTSGTATLDGESMLEQPERTRERLGYLPQDFGFFPHLTGERMLRYLLRLKGVRSPVGEKALCGELLDRVHLSFAARRKVKTYSGGMRQRLGIAQAIAGNPRLMIVDEPTAGLDPEERLRFYRLLSELAQDRIVVLSTHIVEDVAMLCPRFAVIRDGRLIAETTPSLARRAIEGRLRGDDHGRCIRSAGRRPGTMRCASVPRRRPKPCPGLSARRDPPPGFGPVAPTLEDAYLVSIKTGGLRGLSDHPVPRPPSPTARPRGSLPNWPPPSEVRDERNDESWLEAGADGLQRRPGLVRPSPAVRRLGPGPGLLRMGVLRRPGADPERRCGGRGDQVPHHLRVRLGAPIRHPHDAFLRPLRRRGCRYGDHPGPGVARQRVAPGYAAPCRGVRLDEVCRRAGGKLCDAGPPPGGDDVLLSCPAEFRGQRVPRGVSSPELPRPALWFWVPMIVFLAGLSFLVGEWTRRPVAVFLLPVAIVLIDELFLWEWSPSWLDPRINRVLMLLDSSGYRWLNETWLKVDRGVRFYNTASIPPDSGFLVSRAALVVLGWAPWPSPAPLRRDFCAARPRDRRVERRRPACEPGCFRLRGSPRGPSPSPRLHWPRWR